MLVRGYSGEELQEMVDAMQKEKDDKEKVEPEKEKKKVNPMAIPKGFSSTVKK
jgi:SOS response regulatory protein OraA/RecX